MSVLRIMEWIINSKARRPTHDYIPYITRCCVFNHRNKNNGDVCSENLER